MLGSIIQILKAPRLRSGVFDNEPPVSYTNAVQERGVDLPQTTINIDNFRADFHSSALSTPAEESCIEQHQGDQSEHNQKWVAVEQRQGDQSEHNQKWVAVGLSPCTREDACRMQLRVIGESQATDTLKVDFRVAGESSTSNGRDACVTLIRDSSIEICTDQPVQQHSITITLQMPSPPQNNLEFSKIHDMGFVRSVSGISTESTAEHCRICQQTTDEPLIELGCHCRGELAKAHRSCIERWFSNKGSNKCEVCRQVATNLPAPMAPPMHNFWVWRLRHSYRHGVFSRWQGRGQFHPLLAALLILAAGLMCDVLISYYLGASALPVNIIIGVLVVLGVGTGARLIMECCRQRNVSRRIRRMEMAADMDHLNSAI